MATGAPVVRTRRVDPRRVDPGRPAVGLDPGLDEALTAVLDAHGSLVGDLLEQRLRGLMARQVPVRAIRPAPGVRTGRVCFADGTVVLARSAQGKELAAVAMAMHRSSILLTGYARDGGVTRLDLRGRGGQPLATARRRPRPAGLSPD